MSTEALELLLAMFTALAAGFVVGAEREQNDEASFGGIRTFPLYGLAGAVAMLLGWGGLLAVGLGLATLLALAYHHERRDDPGMSTQVAALVTFGLGALCTARDIGLATNDRLLLVASGAIATLALLSVKEPLHRIARRISRDDVYATTKLLLLAVVILPLLPSEDLGPWGALNPRHIGILVVLISGISFAGYVAIRLFGARRGFALTGLLGGLASSTAVTLTFSGRAREHTALVPECALAIILASTTMFPRVLVEVWAVSPSLARAALVPFLFATLLAFVTVTILYQRARPREVPDDDATGLRLKNPFSLASALGFTLLFVVVLLVSRGASELFDEAGVFGAAALTGVADVDAISLSIARMHATGGLGTRTALWGLAIASASNTLAKIGLATVLGGTALGARVAAPLLFALMGGAAVLVLAP